MCVSVFESLNIICNSAIEHLYYMYENIYILCYSMNYNLKINTHYIDTHYIHIHAFHYINKEMLDMFVLIIIK